uniref:Uncharacterized protein n=1 Tax=Anguilla anguilla TaxID=7936 RepID=A0A0E9XD95_ANGAN
MHVRMCSWLFFCAGCSLHIVFASTVTHRNSLKRLIWLCQSMEEFIGS